MRRVPWRYAGQRCGASRIKAKAWRSSSRKASCAWRLLSPYQLAAFSASAMAAAANLEQPNLHFVPLEEGLLAGIHSGNPQADLLGPCRLDVLVRSGLQALDEPGCDVGSFCVGQVESQTEQLLCLGADRHEGKASTPDLTRRSTARS